MIACSVEELDKPALFLLNQLAETKKNVVFLDADMGAGKTTFVKALIQQMGGDDTADSPTFSIVNDYKTDRGVVHHFDLYRLKSVEEVEDIGFWDYIDSGNLCIIEWPNLIAELLPESQFIRVNIDLTLHQCREFSFS
jgi:tRNA threonylcarbamoyladenosine biosynthesis protein TsaE